MPINKKSKFLSADSVFFFSACIILFLINQLYSVLQVSLIMKSTGSIFIVKLRYDSHGYPQDFYSACQRTFHR